MRVQTLHVPVKVKGKACGSKGSPENKIHCGSALEKEGGVSEVKAVRIKCIPGGV